MRRYHQKQLLELVKTLQEAHAEIKRMFSNEEIQAVIGLLAGCQESAVKIGGFIEQLEGEGTKTVSFLEEYCEQLYRLSAAISDPGSNAGILKRLQKQLYMIENSIRTELAPDKIEMLFLPYKASMWDAMESVWLAAKDDPQCNAVVMPIPYYDRHPDGTFGQMQYEGYLYPDYVPVADWRKYNLEERHPDVIVTSNPYDGGNYITSLHPDFYNERLKEFTDLLVYIPYFVSVDDVPAHFCVCAGTKYADKVIVQSEKVRQTYLREFRRFEKENNCNGSFGKAEAKFVALGSPKFDKVINTKREDCQIPDKWRKQIEKPDSSCRKVILYNTSIAGALNGNERALHKLRYVFDCFRNRDDVVLLWRPHPLSTTTYESMRPQFLKEYLNIVTEYKRQGFGIYDDTPDMNRAIAISDAYYGDSGSLLALYLSTGKPVMMQDVDICQTNGRSRYLAFENLYDDGENFWFTAYDFNALFRMDRKTWKTEYIGSFPDEPIDGKRLYGPIVGCGGKLYFTPLFADEIAEYDIASRIFRRIKFAESIDEESLKSVRQLKFNEAVQYRDWVYFVGLTYPAIMRLDTKTGVVDTFNDWVEQLNKLTVKPNGYYFKSACVVGPHLAMAALNANAVVIFDMEVCTSKVYEVGEKGYQYNGICFDGADYWLSQGLNGPVVKWNPATVYKKYNSFPDGFVGNGPPVFWNICYSKGYVWLLPNLANMALKIDIRNDHIDIAEEFQPECHKNDFTPYYIFSKVIADKLFAHTGKSNRLIEYDCNTNERREESVAISEEDVPILDGIRTNFYSKDYSLFESAWHCVFAENADLPLDHYLAGIVHFGSREQADSLSARQIEICKKTISNADGTSGKEIYSYCRQVLMHGEGGKR